MKVLDERHADGLDLTRLVMSGTASGNRQYALYCSQEALPVVRERIAASLNWQRLKSALHQVVDEHPDWLICQGFERRYVKTRLQATENGRTVNSTTKERKRATGAENGQMDDFMG